MEAYHRAKRPCAGRHSYGLMFAAQYFRRLSAICAPQKPRGTTVNSYRSLLCPDLELAGFGAFVRAGISEIPQGSQWLPLLTPADLVLVIQSGSEKNR